MATLLVHITVKDGREAAFENLSRHLYRLSHDLEPGLVRYEYWRGSRPRSYYAHLAFVDFPEFIAHQTSDHHEEASTELRELLESIRLEWIDPVAGASPLGSTENGDLSGSPDELTRRYGEIFAAQVAAWWLPLRSS